MSNTMKKMLIRPKGCFTPNEMAEKLGITGEAVKQWIYSGKLKAAKSANGYWWLRESDVKEFLEGHNKLEFKYHKRLYTKPKAASKAKA
jgi:excisionase family DNA binding protein